MYTNDKIKYGRIRHSDAESSVGRDSDSSIETVIEGPRTTHTTVLYAIITVLLGVVILQTHFVLSTQSNDPSLELWSPANDVVKYETVTFDSFFFNRSPYLGTPAAEKDRLWESLYDFGITGLTHPDASKLLNSTLPAPNDPSTFVIQLNVFHLLHCVNLLRKAIYKDEYPGWEFNKDGTVNHDTILGYHWDHCLDTLRQSIMCDADVTPLSFTHEHEGDYNIFPKLTATHTCRNFDAVRDWAKARQVKNWIGTEIVSKNQNDTA